MEHLKSAVKASALLETLGLAVEAHPGPMLVDRKVRYSALYTNLVGWHAGAVNFHLRDIILAKLACSLSDIVFCLHSGITNLPLYKRCRGQTL